MKNIRKDFPIFDLKEKENKPFVYFDNAATTQKPQVVINNILDFYTKNNANINRGIYSSAEYSTTLYENVRDKIAKFINAESNEIVFTSGATESINMAALSWAHSNIKENDEIIISDLEHHSNFLPWQQLADKKNAILKFIPINNQGELQLDIFKKMLNKNSKLVAVSHVSNALGTQNDIELITKLAQNVGAKVLIDAAQSIAHQRIDVKKIGCDFLAFSGHKMLGPTGIGILYIKNSIHNEIEPYQFGGGMVFRATKDLASWQKMPQLLESGTPAIAQVVGLGAAIDYINNNINFDELRIHEANLCTNLIDGLLKSEKIKILGPIEQLKKNGHILSFVIESFHAHDVAAYLNSYGICVRAGNHCAQPLHNMLKIESSIRVSLYGYNTIEEVTYFIDSLNKLLNKLN